MNVTYPQFAPLKLSHLSQAIIEQTVFQAIQLELKDYKFNATDRQIRTHNFVHDLGLDSLSVMAIITEIECRLQISLPSDDYPDYPSLVAAARVASKL